MAILSFYEGVNPSAAVVDGVATHFVEEERLNRVKHSEWRFPIKAIIRCMKDAGLEAGDIDAVVYPWDSPAYADGRVAEFYAEVREKYGTDPGTAAWQRSNLSRLKPRAVESRLDYELRREAGVALRPDLRYVFVPHHLAHAFTAVAGIDDPKALVLAVDGSGETLCSSVWLWERPNLRLIWSRPVPHSLGWFYAAITEFVGFDAYDGEYKTMGLAGLGEPSPHFVARMANVLRPGEDGLSYTLDRTFIHDGAHTFSSRFTDKLAELLGIFPRARGEEMTDVYVAIAASAQYLLERILVDVCRRFASELGTDVICVSGGVALNVKANGVLLTEASASKLWVPPYPNDSGTPLGAIAHYASTQSLPMPDLSKVYLGPTYEDTEIEQVLKDARIGYSRPDNIAEEVAFRLANGKVVGWFQGRSEAGQRALGGRSILGDPRSLLVARRINEVVKRREKWRPLCPVVLVEDCREFLKDTRVSPFMMIATSATEEALRQIPSVVHADGSTRAQLLRSTDNPLFYELLSKFRVFSGIGVLINTSLNRAGQPMIETAEEALELFGSSAIDALALGPFLVEKHLDLS